MDMHEHPDRAADETEDEASRRPYEPPRVVSSAAFETLALTCNKADAFCHWNDPPSAQS